MSNKALRAALIKFDGVDALAASSFTPAQRQQLDDFARQTKGLQKVRKGAGLLYQVCDRTILASHLAQLVPQLGRHVNEDVPVRAKNIEAARDSKAGNHQHDIYYLLLKSPDPQLVWQNTALSNLLVLGQATQAYGAAVLQIHPEDSWASDGELWLVENQALFDRLDWLPAMVGISIAYYAGQLNRTLLEWLGTRQRAARIVHFPDYDGVGLANYTRLHAAVGDACQLWLMPDWQAKLRRFGSNSLWQATYREFAATYLELPLAAQSLAEQMKLHGLALEQEAVWLQA